MKLRALAAAAAVFCAMGSASAHEPMGVLYPPPGNFAPPAASGEREPPPPCTQDCFVLSELVLRGKAEGPMTFELRGQVRAREETKIPLFGPPSQVRLDDVTIDGARATVTFDSERYYLLTSSRSFTIRGRVTPGDDQMLTVAGPIVSVDARLSKGRVVEGERLSGVLASVLHFDPMDEGVAAKPKAPLSVRLTRALRFGRETSFVMRVVASQGSDIGSLRVPLQYGEKVGDVQGAKEWRVDGADLVLAVDGQNAEVTVAGTMPEPKGLKTYAPDPRSPYEMWMIEADPDHLVAIGGEVKLVELNQAQIPPTMPGARTYLVQRGQHLDIDVRSLVRGDVLAAVARSHHRFVTITGSGELVSDEKLQLDNNGLDHLMVSPAGKAMYLSLGGKPHHILHLEPGAPEILVPLQTGTQVARIQSRSDVRVFPLLGVLSVPGASYPLTTGASETTIGLPADVHPIALTGGDRMRTSFSRGDAVAAILGVVFGCFAFRTRKTRALGALALAGLWFVSKEGYFVAAGLSFVLGALFLASRFVRGTRLLVAGGGIVVVALVCGRLALAEAGVAPEQEMLAEKPFVEADSVYTPPERGDVTPVSLALPTAEKYVKTTRQLVSKDRPFVPRVFYVTSTAIGSLHVVWMLLVGLLAWAHRDQLLELKRRIVLRLSRAPNAAAATEAPPF